MNIMLLNSKGTNFSTADYGTVDCNILHPGQFCVKNSSLKWVVIKIHIGSFIGQIIHKHLIMSIKRKKVGRRGNVESVHVQAYAIFIKIHKMSSITRMFKSRNRL